MIKNPLLFFHMNRFLAFERGAVRIYESFAKAIKDEEIKKYMEKFADIEYTHVQFWEKEIIKRGGKPTTKIADIAVFGTSLISTGVSKTGLLNMLRLGYYSEEIAVRDYSYFVTLWRKKYPQLADKIWQIASDEELHGIWQKEKLYELLGINPGKYRT